MQLASKHSFDETQVENELLERLRDGEQIPEKFERYLLEGKWITITEGTSYLVNFGPNFDHNVSFEGIEG
jgi:hypothetical protein